MHSWEQVSGVSVEGRLDLFYKIGENSDEKLGHQRIFCPFLVFSTMR